jgi:hypothetical protein
VLISIRQSLALTGCDSQQHRNALRCSRRLAQTPLLSMMCDNIRSLSSYADTLRARQRFAAEHGACLLGLVIFKVTVGGRRKTRRQQWPQR